MLLCLLGGLLGIAFMLLTAWGVDLLVTRLDIGFTVSVSGKDIGISLGLSLLVGLLSGLLPSLAASRLNPVDALRAR